MKTKIVICILLTFAMLISCKCKKKKKEEDVNQLGLLPPLTNTGAETAGCLVNGQALLPYGYIPSGNLGCFYQDGKNFGLKFTEKKNGNFKTIHIAILNDSLITGKPYALKIYNDKYGEFIINVESSPSPNYYSTTDNVVGELIITNHIFNQAILSGTFWFDAVNSNGDIMQVREGRFDVHY